MTDTHTTHDAHTARRSRLLHLREVAEYLGLCHDTVHRMCREGRLPYVKIGNRIRVEPEELSKWIAQHRQGYVARGSLSTKRAQPRARA